MFSGKVVKSDRPTLLRRVSVYESTEGTFYVDERFKEGTRTAVMPEEIFPDESSALMGAAASYD